MVGGAEGVGCASRLGSGCRGDVIGAAMGVVMGATAIGATDC